MKNINKKNCKKREVFPLTRISAAVLFALAAHGAQGNPNGGTVTNGQASFATNGNTLTVTNTPGTIIHWQDFSIQAGETTRFAQQSATSTVLNRVTGTLPSSILGSLQSNGRVFLVNTNGIVFGAGSTVNVAGMVATTLNVSDADFLAGRNRFTAATGAQNISNAGNITAESGGQIYLIAPNVENTGIITAANGEILLAAGHSVELVDSTNPNLRVNIVAPAGNATNLGQLVASAGNIGLFGTIVRNSGNVNASSATLQGGKIVFKASQTTEISGTVTANGSTGGTIQILANQVGILDGASISANGTQGGGTVLIGGDAHGTNSAVANAKSSYVAPTAKISADATQNGDGGKVVVWADIATQFGGNISARGGAVSGNGGWVEVSGKQTLGFTGVVDTTAAQGITGTLLLDPLDIRIGPTSCSASSCPLWTAGTLTYTTTGTISSVLNTTTLQNQLALTNVTVDTTSAGTGGTGSILVVGPIVWASANSLTLNATAGGTITTNVNASITNTGTGGLTLTTAGGAITLNDLVSLSGGNISLNAGGGAMTAAGNITTSGLLTATGTLSLSAVNSLGSLTATALNVTAGTTTVSGAFSAPTVNVSGGSLVLTGTVANMTTLNLSGLSTFNSTQAVIVATLQSGASGGTIISVGGVTVSSLLDITSASTLTLSGGTKLTNNGTATLAASSSIGGASIDTFVNANVLNVSGASATISPYFNNTGTVNVSSGAGLTLSGSSTSTSAINLPSGASLTFGTYNGGATYNLSVAGAGNVIISSSGATTINGSITANSLTTQFCDCLSVNYIISGAVKVTTLNANFNPLILNGTLTATTATVSSLYSLTLNSNVAGSPNTIGTLSNDGTVSGTGNLSITNSYGFSQAAGTLGSTFTDLSIVQATGNATFTSLSASKSISLAANAGLLTLTGTFSAPTIAAKGVGLTLSAATTLTASAIGDAIVLRTGTGNFANSTGATALSLTGGGRWLVYSSSPLLDTRGSLANNFKQYNTTFGGTILGTGNGFIYTLAPVVTYGLTGVTKVYDSTTTASLLAANILSATGTIDGDTVVAPTTGSYNSKNIDATSVSFSGVATASNGATTVYGYQYSASGAGSITPAKLNVTANSLIKFFNTADPVLTYAVSGLQINDTLTGTLSGALSRAAGEAAGPYLISIGSLALLTPNYTINYTPGNLTITAPASVLQTLTQVVANMPVPQEQPITEVSEEEKAKKAKKAASEEDPTSKPVETNSVQSLPVCS